MKTKYLAACILLFFAVHKIHAQSAPEAFFGELPVVPSIDCSREPSQQSEAIIAFHSQLDAVIEKLLEVIRAEGQKNKNDKLSKNQIKQVEGQSGLSEKEMEKVSVNGVDKNEKDHLIDKSVQNQTGFSMQDMQKLRSMSKADREKWANENFGKVAQTEKQKSAEPKPIQIGNTSMVSLAQEQQTIAQNLQHQYDRLNKLKSEMEIAASQQRVILDGKLKEIEKKYKDVNDGEGATSNDMQKLRQKRKLVRDAKIDFCSKLTPLNINYLVNYESILKENLLPDLKRHEDIDFQIRKATFPQSERSSIDRLKAIKTYAMALKDAFKFYINVDKLD